MELISGTFMILYTLFIGIYIVLCNENNNKNKDRFDGINGEYFTTYPSNDKCYEEIENGNGNEYYYMI